MVDGDEKSPAWGLPRPPAEKLNGKSAEELRNWAANCTNKISYYLGRIPEGAGQNDGFWEVRMYWHSERKRFLLDAATRLQVEAVDPHHRFMCDATLPAVRPNVDWKENTGQARPAIRPLLPFQARPASSTKRMREEEKDTATPGANPPAGTGLTPPQNENVESPSPTAACIPPASVASLTPSKPPRKKRRKEFELLKDESQARGEDEIDPLLYCDEELSDEEKDDSDCHTPPHWEDAYGPQ